MNPRHIKQLPLAKVRPLVPIASVIGCRLASGAFNRAQFVDLLIEQQGNQGEEV